MDTENLFLLFYADVDGAPTERQIDIKSITIGAKKSNSYIKAYCYLAGAMRTFRFDRIKKLYYGKDRIKDPLSFLAEKYAFLIDADIEDESTDLQNDSYEKPEPRNRNAGLDYRLPENESASPPAAEVKPEIVKDIPTFKKGRRNSFLIAIICIILGIVSIATVILPILFFIAAVIFLMAARTAKKQIKELESAEVK